MTPFETPADSPNVAAANAEPLYTFSAAAEKLGVKTWHIQRAVKRGDIPFYTPFNSRKLVRLSDVNAVINSARQGGE